MVFVSFFLGFAEDADTTERIETFDRSSGYRGLGLNFGFTLFYPSEVNDMINDIYNEFLQGYEQYAEMLKPALFWGISLKGKGVFYLNRQFSLEPYGQIFTASESIDHLLFPGFEYIYVFFFSGGINCWFRFNTENLVSFKTGVGAFSGYGRIEMDGGVGRLSMSGPGFGVDLLAGLDLTFRKVIVNMDFSVPVGVIRYLHRKGDLILYGENGYTATPPVYTNYPAQLLLLGFEFKPGVTFKF